MTRHTWECEFDASFDVPDVITQAEGIEDLSWHNDVCPSFGVEWPGLRLRVWVRHPDLDERDGVPERFVVMAESWDVWAQNVIEATGLYDSSEGRGDPFESDDPVVALAEFMRQRAALSAAAARTPKNEACTPKEQHDARTA